MVHLRQISNRLPIFPAFHAAMSDHITSVWPIRWKGKSAGFGHNSLCYNNKLNLPWWLNARKIFLSLSLTLNVIICKGQEVELFHTHPGTQADEVFIMLEWNNLHCGLQNHHKRDRKDRSCGHWVSTAYAGKWHMPLFLTVHWPHTVTWC